jgi:small-conductance mechanosensitive channel
VPDDPHDGRNETEEERSDRNLVELLQEVRVVQTGVQILFGFLLTIAFQPKFEKLSSFQKGVYLGTLVAAATTLIMLTAPSSWHRILFRQRDKEHLVNIANRFTVLGLASMGLTMVGVVMLLSDLTFPTWLTILVTAVAVIACSVLWYAMPLARRRALGRRSSLSDPHRLDPVLPDGLDPDREAVR